MRNRTATLFLLAAALLTPPAAAAEASCRTPSKMNVLFIIIEDCNAGVWGSYGNPICKTPNMDRFATHGGAVRFGLRAGRVLQSRRARRSSRGCGR